jgi:hypothetical protein
MNVRAILVGAAWSITLSACATQQPQSAVIPGTIAIAPCIGDQKLAVSNFSNEAVRVIAEPRGDPHTSADSRGGYREMGRVRAGTEASFLMPANVRAIWIEAVDQPRTLNGSQRVVKGVAFACVASNS